MILQNFSSDSAKIFSNVLRTIELLMDFEFQGGNLILKLVKADIWPIILDYWL